MVHLEVSDVALRQSLTNISKNA